MIDWLRIVPYLLCMFVSGWSVWNYQASRYELRIANMEKDYAKSATKVAQENLDAFTKLQKTKDAAIKSAESRAAANRRAAVDATVAADGLRDELAKERARLATSTCESVTKYATTLNTVLDQCQAEYRAVAEKADGHAADAKTLTEAWPTLP